MAYTEKLPSGAYRGVFRDPWGKRHTKTFRRKSDADRWAKDAEAVAKLGYDPKAQEQRFDDWAAEWWSGQRHLRATTRAGYAAILNGRLIPRFGRTPLGGITRREVEAWIGELQLEGRSPDTISDYFRLLRTILLAAVNAGRIHKSPTDGVKLPRPEVGSMRFLTIEELARLTAAVDPRYRALVEVMGFGGLRFGEAVALEVGDIDVEASRISVTKQLVETSDNTLQWGAPKTSAGMRSVPLPRPVMDSIAKNMAGLTHGPIFTAPEGGPVRRRNWRSRVWLPAAKRAGLIPPALRVHDLRHTAISQWIAHGADVRTIATIAGHTSVRVTLDRYGHMIPGQDDALMRALTASLGADAP